MSQEVLGIKEYFGHNGTVLDLTFWAKENLRLPESKGELLLLKGWQDIQTSARGWVACWGDPRITAAGGGIRMRPGATVQEAIYLAAVMNEKFGISGPEINGCKFVIDFDSSRKEKAGVLVRFTGAFLTLLQTHLGTAGDLGVSEQEVRDVLHSHGIRTPQEGILKALGLSNRLDKFDEIVNLHLKEELSSKHKSLVDIVSGWSAFVATRSFIEENGGSLVGKRVVLHGIGVVGGSTGYFLEKAGAQIVAVADSKGSLYLGNAQFASLLKEIDPVSGCLPRTPSVTLLGDPEEVLAYPADILVLAATSEVVTLDNVDRIKAPLCVEVANYPITPAAGTRLVEKKINVLPDLIVSSGTAQLFSIAMLGDDEISEEAILSKIDETTHFAIRTMTRIATQRKTPFRQAARRVSELKLWQRRLIS